MSRTANSIKTFITSAFGDILLYVLRFVTRTIFINTLGVEYLGIEGLFSNILTLLSFTDLGFGVAITFRLYKPIAEHDTKRIQVLMKLYKYVYRGIGIIIIILGLCCIPLLPLIISDYDNLVVLGISAPLIFMLYVLQTASTYLFFAYKNAITRAHQKTYKLTVASYPISLASSITQILVLIFLQDFVIYVACVILFNVLKNFIFAVISERLYPEELKNTEESVSKQEILEMVKDCGALLLYKTNNVVLKATDNIVLSVLLGLASVGIYANYLMIHNAMQNILGHLFKAMTASIGNLHAEHAGSARELKVFRQLNHMSFFVYGIVDVAVFCALDSFVTVWVGDEYVLGVSFAAFFCLENYLKGNMRFIGQFRDGMGLFQQVKIRPIISALVNVVVSVWGVMQFGVLGVVLGTVAAHLMADFWIDALMVHKYGLAQPLKEYGMYMLKNLYFLVILLASGAVAYVLCTLVGFDGWIAVFVNGCIGFAVFLLFACVFTFRMPEFKDNVAVIVRLFGKLGRKIVKHKRL